MADNPRVEALLRRLAKDAASIAFAQLAEEYRRAGDHDRAIQICREGLTKHPGYLSAQVTLGRALIEAGQFEEARAELEAVQRVAPDNLAAIRALAEIHQRYDGDLVSSLTGVLDESTNSARHMTEAPQTTEAPQEAQDTQEAPGSPAAEVQTMPPDIAADILPVPDLSDWTADVEMSLDPPLEIEATSVRKPDPVLDALEQWLMAIVADRANAR